MRPISEVYPGCIANGEEWFFSPGDYRPMLDSLGHEILVQVDDDDYQGDSYLLLRRDDGAYGLLEFGWGSCSGCDALQACDSYEEIDKLRGQIAAGVRWFASLAEVSAALDTDRSDQWYGSGDEWREFVGKAKEALA